MSGALWFFAGVLAAIGMVALGIAVGTVMDRAGRAGDWEESR